MSKKKRIVARGPGAAPAVEFPYQPEVDLPPRRTELPVGPDHILYPVLVGLALFPILMGSSGHHLAEDMPDDETHPFLDEFADRSDLLVVRSKMFLWGHDCSIES